MAADFIALVILILATENTEFTEKLFSESVYDRCVLCG